MWLWPGEATVPVCSHKSGVLERVKSNEEISRLRINPRKFEGNLLLQQHFLFFHTLHLCPMFCVLRFRRNYPLNGWPSSPSTRTRFPRRVTSGLLASCCGRFSPRVPRRTRESMWTRILWSESAMATAWSGPTCPRSKCTWTRPMVFLKTDLLFHHCTTC